MRPRFLVPFLVLVAAACGRGQRSSAPQITQLVGDVGGDPFQPAISPDGKRLAWTQPVNGQAAIHVGNADGSDPVVLTHGSWDRNPVWSPDGKWIAYLAEGPNFDLMVVPSNGGEPKQLTSEPGEEVPVGWLRDGSAVVFYHEGAGDVQTLIAPLDGSTPHPIVPAMGGNQYVAISPDGSKAVFDLHRGSESTIWIQDLPNGKPRQLTTEGFESIEPTEHAWSPDGRHIAFESRRSGTSDIWTADVETGKLNQLTYDVHDDNQHAWSPDGKWIAFVSNRGGQTDIWVIPSTGGQAVRVTNDLASEGIVQWSPDGRTLIFMHAAIEGGLGVASTDGGSPRMVVDWPGYGVGGGGATLSPDGATVLFTSDRSGNPDIWSVPVAGGEPKPFAASPLVDRQPQFSPDGSQVLFSSNRAGSVDLWVMPAAGGDARRLTDWPSDESGGRWSPDGSKIAFVSTHENNHQDVWLVASDGGTPKRLTTFGAEIRSALNWSPDGRDVYVIITPVGGQDALYRVPVAGGRPEKLPMDPNGGIGALSRDGKQFAYSVFTDGWAFIDVLPTSGGASRRITKRTERVYQLNAIWSPDGTRLAVSDWGYGDDPTPNVLEMSVNDTTRHELTHIPHSTETPIAYTSDGQHVVFSMLKGNVIIASVPVADVLAKVAGGQ